MATVLTPIRWIGLGGALTLLASCAGDSSTAPTPTPNPELPPRGKINITVSTAGSHVDLDGYQLWVDSQPISTVGANGSVTIADVAIGIHEVRLDGLALNCSAENPVRSVDVTFAAPVSVSFSVVCMRTGVLAYANTLEGYLYLVNSDGNGSSRIGPRGAHHPAWSPSGDKIAFDVSGQDREIHVINGDGSRDIRLTTGSYSHSPAWSPDGGRIAFVTDHDGNGDIYVMSADGTNLDRLTSSATNDTDPAWSPDGSRIAFSSARDRYEGIYIMHADGSAVTRLSPPNVTDRYPSWSPDGTTIVFSRQTLAEGQAIFTMKADGTDTIRLTPHFNYAGAPAWSPDGQIAFATETSCTHIPYYLYDCVGEMLIIKADKTVYTLLSSGNTHDPAWRP